MRCLKKSSSIVNGYVYLQKVAVCLYISVVTYIYLSLIHIFTIGYGMQYLGLTVFNELGNGFVNDRQVDIAVMCISLRSVMACSNLV